MTGKHIATLGQGCRPDCESQRGFNPALRLSLHFSTARLETMETARITQPCNCIIMTSDCHCDVSIPSGNTLLFLPRFPPPSIPLSEKCAGSTLTQWKSWFFAPKTTLSNLHNLNVMFHSLHTTTTLIVLNIMSLFTSSAQIAVPLETQVPLLLDC